jgi:hypothetical protein
MGKAGTARSSVSVNSGDNAEEHKTARTSLTEFATELTRFTLRSDKRPVFPNKAQMIEKVRDALGQAKYDVCDLYWETGFSQRLARRQDFEMLTLVVITINAFWLAVDADYNVAEDPADTHLVFRIADNLFCAYFFFEWLIRFLAFRHKLQGFTDAWFAFDSFLCALMVFETWLLPFVLWISGGGAFVDVGFLRLLRLLRLARTGRMAKVLHSVPEMLVMIKGIATAMRSVFFMLLFLTMVMYVYAITFRQLTMGLNYEHSDVYFSSIPTCMLSLLLDGVLPDNAEMVYNLAVDHWALAILQVTFVLITGLTILNMLIGVLCEVVGTVAACEREEMAADYVRSHLEKILADGDEDGNQLVSKDEFEHMMMQDETRRVLMHCGVDIIGLMGLQEFIFREADQISFGEFFSMVLQLRGGNPCTVKDIVDTRNFMHTEVSLLSERIQQWLEDVVNHHTEEMREIRESSMVASKSGSSSYFAVGGEE